MIINEECTIVSLIHETAKRKICYSQHHVVQLLVSE